jgi:hypothetical protein
MVRRTADEPAHRELGRGMRLREAASRQAERYLAREPTSELLMPAMTRFLRRSS